MINHKLAQIFLGVVAFWVEMFTFVSKLYPYLISVDIIMKEWWCMITKSIIRYLNAINKALLFIYRCFFVYL